MGASENLRVLEKGVSHSPDVICTIDSQGYFRYVSAACRQVLGHDADDLIGRRFTDILCLTNRPAALQSCLQAYEQVEPVGFESCVLTQAGQEVRIAWSAFRPPANEMLLCVGRSLPQRQATQPVPQQQALDHVLIAHGFDMVALLNEAGTYTYVGGSTQQALGYRPEQLLGRSAFDFIHPEDLARVESYWTELGTQAVVTIPDFRFRTASGEWKWIETTVSNQLHNPTIQAYAASSRDVSERRNNSSELAESEQRFRLLFENTQALAAFQNTEGLILDANAAFLAFVNKPRQEIINRPLVDFLPFEVRPMFNLKFQEALSGQEVRYEVRVNDKQGEQRILSVTKIPLVVNHKLIGLHVTAKDITEIVTAQRLIKRQADQLNTIFESITDAFFSLDKDWNLTYINHEAERLIGMTREQGLGKNLWTVFPQEIDGIFHQQYHEAIETNVTVRFEAFFQAQNRWFDVKAFPSEGGLSVYFSDITAQIGANHQLKLMAMVARSTDNSIIVTDALGRTEWVNAGFTKHTGYVLADMVGKTPGAVLQGPETDPAAIQRFRERMKLRTPFSVVILNYKKSGQKLWYSMDITPIYSDAGELTHFVSVQQNINYRKEIEASQAKMTQDLYRHNRDLQQFTYVISHNLRSPLANALGLATLLTKVDKSSKVFDDSLAHLRKSMQQADAVLKDLNTVLSIRDKQDMLEPESVALADVCQQVILNLEEPLHQCDGHVTLAIEDGFVVRGTRAYLYSIFYNLLSNSIKYRSDERKLEVEIKCSRGEHGGPTISFTDNGSGFDMFKAGSDVFQLYKRFHTNQRGRGIGLFLVKTHVEAMEGKIEVTSGVDFGTRFLIHLDKR